MLKRLFIVLALFSLAACEPPAVDTAAAVRVRMQTSAGDIVLSLNRAKAPLTVDNFLAYAGSGFYEGTLFHRVIDGFMIQGGGYDSSLKKKPTRLAIKNEADNGLLNRRGSIAMARTQEPHSATSQFFINVNDNDFLNHRQPTPQGWGYTVFGEVIEGMDVVDRIKSVPTGPSGPFRSDVPQTPIVIHKVTIETGS